jgi:hypothetical protein
MAGSMGSIADTARTVGVPLRYAAGLELVRSTDAPRLIDALRAAGTRIVGAEGFRLERNDAVRPVMEAILDLSSIADPRESADEAERFMRSAAEPELWFELTVQDSAGS